MRVRYDWLALGLAFALIVPGCTKKQAETSAPNMDAGGESRAPGDSPDPLAELAALEVRMRAFGLPVASDTKAASATEGQDAAVGVTDASEDRTAATPAEEAETPTAVQSEPPMPSPERDQSPTEVCGDLCSLSESICELEVRICSLAEHHRDDAVYADACERAVEDCKVAGEACDGCG